MNLYRQFPLVVKKVYNYAFYIDLAYLHLKSYRASSVSYKTSIFSAVSNLSPGLLFSSFLTPGQFDEFVENLTKEEALQVCFHAAHYEVQFLEIVLLSEG